MIQIEKSSCERRHAFYVAIPEVKDEMSFGIEVEGQYLFVTYFGNYFEEVTDFNGRLPKEKDGTTELPRVGRHEIGQRNVSDLSTTELEALRSLIARLVVETKARVESIHRAKRAVIDARVEGGRKNRERKACARCEDLNSTPRRFPNGTDSPFTCDCGIRYAYNRQLRYWERKTVDESQHDTEEMLFVLRYGEPNHCG